MAEVETERAAGRGAYEVTATSEESRPSNRETPSFHQSSRARWLLLALTVGVAAVAVLLWRHYSGWESTDDAQIDGHIIPVSARVMGQVMSVKVRENQQVEAGAVLVERRSTAPRPNTRTPWRAPRRRGSACRLPR